MESFTCQKCSLTFRHPNGCLVRADGTSGCPKCGHSYAKWDSFADSKNSFHEISAYPRLTTEKAVRLYGSLRAPT